LLIGTLLSCDKGGDNTPDPPPGPATFSNPLRTGSDPWVLKKDSFYYYTQTLGNRIAVWKTKAMSKLGFSTSTTLFTPGTTAPNSSNIWAPEIHLIDNKWYIYYTAGSGPDITQRTWVLENSNADPFTGAWVDKGKIFSTDADFWAIDGTVMAHNGSNYFLWSGRPDPAVQNQNIYIAKMVNPWTLQTPAVMISKPELTWELHGGPVNEAPQYLQRGGKNFILYSASGCWTDDYTLGMLTLKTTGDPLVASDWEKNPQPLLTKNPQNNAYGPGHNAFFKSQDGTEDWIIYHANTNPNEGCAEKRNVRIQKFNWNADGTPNLGTPVKPAVASNVPSGE
jgi:GH43 family beta-xylosidase